MLEPGAIMHSLMVGSTHCLLETPRAPEPVLTLFKLLDQHVFCDKSSKFDFGVIVMSQGQSPDSLHPQAAIYLMTCCSWNHTHLPFVLLTRTQHLLCCDIMHPSPFEPVTFQVQDVAGEVGFDQLGSRTGLQTASKDGLMISANDREWFVQYVRTAVKDGVTPKAPSSKTWMSTWSSPTLLPLLPSLP